jgi:predicted DCC family thiol-disulfide oxidoreductase YuxK
MQGAYRVSIHSAGKTIRYTRCIYPYSSIPQSATEILNTQQDFKEKMMHQMAYATHLNGEVNEEASTIVFFDGVCNLCNGVVRWLIDHDPHQRLHFAPLQGSTYAALCGALHGQTSTIVVPRDALASVAVYSRGRLWFRSAAMLEIIVVLGGWWRCLLVFGLIPVPLRDAIYELIARHRYRWFGRRQTCVISVPSAEARFLP